MQDRLNACLDVFKGRLGSREIVVSPLVKRFKIGSNWGLFEGAFLGKVFLDNPREHRLWTYLQRPRNYLDLCNYLKRIAKSKTHLIDLLKKLQFLIDERFLVHEGTTAKALFKSSSKEYFRHQRLKYLYILPTLNCNFCCPHCSIMAKLSKSQMKSISAEHLRNGIDVFYDNLDPDVDPLIRAFGGEPLTEFKIVEEIVSYINRKERTRLALGKQLHPGKVMVSTNATLIDRKIADWLFANDIGVSVSLDGRKKANDRMRAFRGGTGTFDAVMKGIRHLQRADVQFSIGVTIGRYNIDSIENDVKWMASNLSKSITLNIMQDFIVGHNPSVISARKLSRLTGILGRLYKYLEKNGAFESKYHYLWNQFIEGLPRNTYCAANGGEVALMPDGSISPCHHLVHGNKYRVYPRRGMRIQNTRVWREWMNRTSYNIETLNRDCPYRLLCAGGCTVAAMKDRRGLNHCARNICSLMEFHVKYMMEQCLRIKS